MAWQEKFAEILAECTDEQLAAVVEEILERAVSKPVRCRKPKPDPKELDQVLRLHRLRRAKRR